MNILRFAFTVAVAVAAIAAIPFASAQDARRYVDPELGHSIVLPNDGFGEVGFVDGKLQMASRDGLAQLTVYGEPNAEGLSVEEIAASLESSETIGDVTYRAGGGNWRVLSGFYRDVAARGDDLVFYLKLMMSPDRARYAVFAVSYPRSEKRRYDPVVERLEDSFRPPA